MSIIIKNLLSECELLSEYEEIFNDNLIDDNSLILLDEEGIKQLIPRVGHHLRFKKVFKEWKIQQQLLTDSFFEDIHHFEDSTKSKSTEQNNVTLTDESVKIFEVVQQSQTKQIEIQLKNENFVEQITIH